MKKEVQIYVPILGIVIAELLIFGGDIFYGLGIHLINLLAIIFIIIFSSLERDMKNILQGLILVILLRMIGFSVPQFFTATIVQYALIYGVAFVPIYSIAKEFKSLNEFGINFKKIYIYIPLSIVIGAFMGIIEYGILVPAPLIDSLNIPNIILISLVMFLFIATVEEIIFRSVLQTRIEKIFGMKYGILLTGGLFGIMHSSYGIFNEIIFASIFGIILGYLFSKTKSLPFIISAHGIANIMLFAILPLLL